ncbi:hypothetical protein [Acinetobacter sp. Ac_5812]|uniref:hypothetical protein n=1 Tax=Acinetobacter sp. Ac_5812 TaxID=1848937 RepID=UPI001D2CAE48|nr:hypothetical protein [Acinetobacter sp. Ac_5812]NNP71082.1 hypothetical protein [Acinetobacter sp. Ac_5812]
MNIKRAFCFFVKILKWFFIVQLAFILFLWAAVYIADIYFDNAAKKDSCADSGGAWDYKRDICTFGPNDPRTKREECEKLDGIWNFNKKQCIYK